MKRAEIPPLQDVQSKKKAALDAYYASQVGDPEAEYETVKQEIIDVIDKEQDASETTFCFTYVIGDPEQGEHKLTHDLQHGQKIKLLKEFAAQGYSIGITFDGGSYTLVPAAAFLAWNDKDLIQTCDDDFYTFRIYLQWK